MKLGSALGRYMRRALLWRILAATAVLVVLGISIDLIKSATELLDEGGAPALLSYAALRSIQIATTLLPTGILLGATIGFLTLAHRSELVVVRAAGLSTFGLLRLLLPLAVGLGIGLHLIGDRPVAWAELRLAEIVPATANAPQPGAKVWSRVRTAIGGEVLRADLAAADGSALADVTLWRLNAEGRIVARFTAETAAYGPDGWRLRQFRRNAGDPPVPERAWDTLLTPEAVRKLAAQNLSVSTADARAAIAGAALQTRSAAYYATRIAHSYAELAIPAVMLILAAIASFGLSRGGGGLRKAALGIAIGLVYVASDGIMRTFGEVGALPPYLAVAAPSLIFGAIGLWMLFLQES